MTDRIEKYIELKAPVDKVWRALTDHTQFGTWFKVNIEAPFEVGKTARGIIGFTIRGRDDVVWEGTIVKMDPQTTFAFTWHPFAIEADVDYSSEPQTLVEFTLEPAGAGTHLRVVESGFDALPAHRRDEAFRMNDGGWTAQMENIRAYVER